MLLTLLFLFCRQYLIQVTNIHLMSVYALFLFRRRLKQVFWLSWVGVEQVDYTSDPLFPQDLPAFEKDAYQVLFPSALISALSLILALVGVFTPISDELFLSTFVCLMALLSVLVGQLFVS